METQDALQSPQFSKSRSNGFIRSVCSEVSLKISGIWHPKRRSSKDVREDHISTVPSTSTQVPQNHRGFERWNPEIFRVVFFGEETWSGTNLFSRLKHDTSRWTKFSLYKQIIDPQVTFSAKYKHHYHLFLGEFLLVGFFLSFSVENFGANIKNDQQIKHHRIPRLWVGSRKISCRGENPQFSNQLCQYNIGYLIWPYFLGGNAAFGGYP